MAVSNHFSNYTPLHCASHGAPAGFGRMLRWAEGVAGTRGWGADFGEGQGRWEDGPQGPGDLLKPVLLPRASRRPGLWTGEFPGAQGPAEHLDLLSFSLLLVSPQPLHPIRTAVGALPPATCHGLRNIRVSDVRQNSGAQPGHNLFVSSVLPFYLLIYFVYLIAV